MHDSAREALWLLRAQSGDREALERLLAAARGIVRRYVAPIVGISDVDDVTQDVLFLVYRKLAWLEEPELFRPWVYRVATRAAFRHLKKSNRWRETSLDEVREDVVAIEDVPPSIVEELLTAPGISPASRAVMVLHFQEGMTLPDAAAVLGIPTGTAKSRLAYGLAKLRAHLRQFKEFV